MADPQRPYYLGGHSYTALAPPAPPAAPAAPGTVPAQQAAVAPPAHPQAAAPVVQPSAGATTQEDMILAALEDYLKRNHYSPDQIKKAVPILKKVVEAALHPKTAGKPHVTVQEAAREGVKKARGIGPPAQEPQPEPSAEEQRTHNYGGPKHQNYPRGIPNPAGEKSDLDRLMTPTAGEQQSAQLDLQAKRNAMFGGILNTIASLANSPAAQQAVGPAVMASLRGMAQAMAVQNLTQTVGPQLASWVLAQPAMAQQAAAQQAAQQEAQARAGVHMLPQGPVAGKAMAQTFGVTPWRGPGQPRTGPGILTQAPAVGMNEAGKMVPMGAPASVLGDPKQAAMAMAVRNALMHVSGAPASYSYTGYAPVNPQTGMLVLPNEGPWKGLQIPSPVPVPGGVGGSVSGGQ